MIDFMIQCLHGIAVIALVLTMTVLSLLWHHPFDDPEVKDLLARPNLITQWSDRHSVTMSPKISPLVSAAKVYTETLTSARPKDLQPNVIRTNALASVAKRYSVRPPRTSPKFRVLATSVYPADPTKSMALISYPGNESYWVHTGDKLGYLVVHAIKPTRTVTETLQSQSHQRGKNRTATFRRLSQTRTYKRGRAAPSPT